MCYLVAHDRLQLYYKEYEINIGDSEITDDATIKKLESLGATLILLIYGLNCFVKILMLDMRHISML